MKKRYWIILIALGALALFFVVRWLEPPDAEIAGANLIADTDLPAGYQRALGPRQWTFPADFGPHPDYLTEWWYYTGNLAGEGGERFGYELTFFRRALLPAAERGKRQSTLAADQVYMAHFALSDIDAGEHHAFERFARGAAELAGAQAEPYQVWLENWEVLQVSENRYQLTAQQGEIAVDLILEDLKGPILHGDSGYSQKGAQTGNASYYYSQTLLQTTGSVNTPSGNYQVSGLSWKDHEFSTSALAAGQVGWDWFSIQLDGGGELMVFQLRNDDGSIDPFSSGTWIDQNGGTTPLNRDQFEIQVLDTWRSPNSGGEYPARWVLNIPSLDLNLQVEPYLADQEMDVSYTYWEGAVEVNGTMGGGPISGDGYVEMTGYTHSIEGAF